MWAEVKAKFPQKEYHDTDIFEEVQECLEMESEIPAVHQEWIKLPMEDFESFAIKVADEYWHKKNVIIPYKVSNNKTKESLLKRKAELLDTMDIFKKSKGVSKRTSNFIGCKTCGSSMARTYFEEGEHTCRICGGELWSETNQKSWRKYIESLDKIDKRLEKCRDTYEVYYYVQASLKIK